MAKVTLLFNANVGFIYLFPGFSCLYSSYCPTHGTSTVPYAAGHKVKPFPYVNQVRSPSPLVSGVPRTRDSFSSFTIQPCSVTSKPLLTFCLWCPKLSPPNADNSSQKKLSLEKLKMFKLRIPQSSLHPHHFDFRLYWMGRSLLISRQACQHLSQKP